MTDKVPLAEQIGVIDELTRFYFPIAARGGKDGYEAGKYLEALSATKATLVFLMNNRDEFLAFMAGKEGE